MEVGLLLLHVVVGALVAGHGAQKLFGVLGGHGPTGTAGFFESLGMRPGKPLAYAAGASELVGGLLLALGLATPLAAVLIVSVMVVAARTAHAGKGPWITDGGWELNVAYGVVAVALAATGAGALSLDAVIGWDVAGVEWAVGALVLGVLGAVSVLTLGRARSSADRSAPAGA